MSFGMEVLMRIHYPQTPIKGVSPINWRRHLTCFVLAFPAFVFLSGFMEWLAGGFGSTLEQSSSLISGALFFFFLDLTTALIFRVAYRGEEHLSSAAMGSGAVKAFLWIAVGGGTTIIANTFPVEVSEFGWTNPDYIAANIDVIAFIYMYLVEGVSIVENITGKPIGETRLGEVGKKLLRFVAEHAGIISSG